VGLTDGEAVGPTVGDAVGDAVGLIVVHSPHVALHRPRKGLLRLSSHSALHLNMPSCLWNVPPPAFLEHSYISSSMISSSVQGASDVSVGLGVGDGVGGSMQLHVCLQSSLTSLRAQSLVTLMSTQNGFCSTSA
jgi:hypothetical protein